ncbi:heat shock protein 67B1 [Drosophila tropicalis]|uniref:heat shock protein 67B1 n=1 Tax=Drosophila tropicalis TaxID=46794 RepID=UPI0035ABE183
MSLIPFILELAEELNDFNRSVAMDVDDVGFGMYPLEQLAAASAPTQQHSRLGMRLGGGSPNSTSSSVLWVPVKGQPQQQQQHRHHPYNRVAGAKTACCNKSIIELERDLLKATYNTAPSSSTSALGSSKSSHSVVNRNGFQVSMNVKQFAAAELTVKTIDNCIVVEGQHDEKEDGHGVISRHFIRKYILPKGYDPVDVHSTLSSDGILTVKASPPPPPIVKGGGERIVDIQQTKSVEQVVASTIPAPTPTPTSTTAATASIAAAAEPKPKSFAAPALESNGNAIEKGLESGNAVENEAADEFKAATKETEEAAVVETTSIAISNAKNGEFEKKLETVSMNMEVEAAVEKVKETVSTEDTPTTNPIPTPKPTPISTPTPITVEPDSNANNVEVSSNNGNTNTKDAQDAAKDKAKADEAASNPVSSPEALEKPLLKGAEELAAQDAAILLAKKNPVAPTAGENGSKPEELTK